MVDLELVKRKRKKKIAAATAMISSVVLGVLCIVAFLGKEVGTFTITIDNHSVALALGNKGNDFSDASSYLRVDNVPSFSGGFSYKWFGEKPEYSFTNIDNEATSPMLGAVTNQQGEITGMRFFKYTYYVKNVGDQYASYTTEIDITRCVEPTNMAYGLQEYLRVGVFKDGDLTVYAKPNVQQIGHTDEDGKLSYSEPISGKEGEASFCGYCTDFKSDKIVTTITGQLASGDEERFTILFWLEGNDPECNKIPVGASINFGVAVEGYEG